MAFEWGAFAFGLVVGWITYRTVRRNTSAVQLSDLAAVLGAIGGASITAIFKNQDLFNGYSAGLAVGFFAYLIVSLLISGKKVDEFMGDN